MATFRSRSRSPLGTKNNNSSNDQDLFLYVTNLPVDWKYSQIRKFISDTTSSKIAKTGVKFVEVIKKDGQPSGACVISFNDQTSCHTVLKQLDGIKCQGKNIEVTLRNGNNDSPKPKKRKDNAGFSRLASSSKKIITQPENEELYGLNLSFLGSLGITLPLVSRIYISNISLKVDEAKLHEVFSYAGNIIRKQFLNVKERSNSNNEYKVAKVEYDHPVEAVQAVSMFHGQLLYERELSVTLDSMGSKLFLPDGLRNLGPGLGANGMPLKGIRTEVELQPIKHMMGIIQEVITKNNTLGSTEQIPIASIHNPMSSILNPVGSIQKQISSLRNAAALTQNKMGPLLTPMGHTQQQMGLIPNPMGLIQNSQLDTSEMAGNTLQGFNNPLTPFNMNSLNLFNQSLMGFSPYLNVQDQQLQMLKGLQMQEMGNIGALNSMSHNMDQLGSNINQISNTQRTFQNQDNMQDESSNQKANKYNNFRWGDNSSNNNVKENVQKDSSGSKESTSTESTFLSSDMLVFNNLPSSVTVAVLNKKMQEVGALKFAEITGNGRAIVRFMNSSDAERCINLFDRSKVDGQVIEVKYY